MTYQTKVQRRQGGDELHLAEGAVLSTADGIGAAATGVSALEHSPIVHKTILTLAAAAITITKGSNAGYGSLKLYDFPDGAIQILGGLVNLAIARVGTNLSAVADGDVHVGTTAQTDVAIGNILGTEHDLVATATIPQLVSGAGPANSQGGPRTAPADGTGTARDAYLNFLFDSADLSGSDAITATGTITLFWIGLGDY